jgi:hypothetical protein
MDPVTAITKILSLIPDLLMTKGGPLIAGRYIGGRYFSTAALTKGGYLYTGVLYSADARRNKWVRFLRIFRKYVSKT